MEIAHQLPGRVRIRIPGLESEDYCRQVVEELSHDGRITHLRMSAACNSLVVYFDPIRIEIKEILAYLTQEAENRSAAKKSPGLTEEETLSAEPDAEAAGDLKAPATSKYFKAALSADVQEKIREIIHNEDPRKPLSDGRISELLKKEKVDIARRTVAKYREIMKIPPSTKRRKMHTC